MIFAKTGPRDERFQWRNISFSLEKPRDVDSVNPAADLHRIKRSTGNNTPPNKSDYVREALEDLVTLSLNIKIK